MGPIPACAGQPGCPRIRGAAFGAYPRVCGATAILWLAHEKNLGLSPRVRGNLLPHPISWLLRGPIPACAGQPAPIIGGRRIARAYPRVCGATGQQRDVMVIVPGLSPRVRGNRRHHVCAAHQRGPIPACAGQPRRGHAQCRPDGAYPRVCGATSCRRRDIYGGLGLSPRVRGNLSMQRVG